MLSRLCLVILMLIGGMAVKAQGEDTRWALNYNAGVFLSPVLTSNPQGVNTGRGSSAFSVSGEYYLPKRWNVLAGYHRTELSYGNADRTMEGLLLGMKKYFVNPDLFVQPYVGAGMQVNWGDHKVYESFNSELFSRHQQTRNPRMSFQPSVGAELYIFSSVAFVMEYNFVMGVNSKTDLTITDNGYRYSMADNGMYHYLGLGVKITFPFRFTSNDGRLLGGTIAELIIDALDRSINSRY